jgi:MFS family permease
VSDKPARGAAVALTLLAVIAGLNYYDRLLVVVIGQSLRLEFHLSDRQFGLLTGPAFVFVYAVASLVFGALADRYRRRRVIAVALALWSATTAICGFASSFALLALGRAGTGIGEGGANPAAMSLLSDHYPPERRPMALAIFNSGGMVGLCLSFVLGSAVAAHFGWRAVFFTAGLPGLIVAFITVRAMPEPARGRFEPVTAVPTYPDALRRLVANPAYVWLCVAACLGVFSSLGMLIWLPQFYLRSHHLSPLQVGLLFGPAAAVGLCLGMMLGGWLGDRVARRDLAAPVTICIVANLVLVPVMIAALWLGSTGLSLAATFLAMGLAVVYAPAFQASMQTVCEPGLRGTAAAISNVLNSIVGQGLLPLLVGVLSDALMPQAGSESLRWALTVMCACPLLSGLLFIGALAPVRRGLAAA